MYDLTIGVVEYDMKSIVSADEALRLANSDVISTLEEFTDQKFELNRSIELCLEETE
jgi:hypothetical protein